MQKKVLLTGFSPFGGLNTNSSIEACKKLVNKTIRGYKIVVSEIPLEFFNIKPTIEKLIEEHNPNAVICTGQSGRAKISIERVAINIADSKFSYNCGYTPHDKILEDDGPVGYFSTLPIKKILARLKENKIPAEISNSAGTYGCNQLFYHLMHYLSKKGLKIPAGFVHVPHSPEQVLEKNLPSMSLELISMALKVIIETVIEELSNNNSCSE